MQSFWSAVTCHRFLSGTNGQPGLWVRLDNGESGDKSPQSKTESGDKSPHSKGAA